MNRFITCALMMVVGVGYRMVRGYGGDMLTISIGVYFYRMIDALADVYEGRLQQQDKFYLAGIRRPCARFSSLFFFSLALLITRNVGVASIVMAGCGVDVRFPHIPFGAYRNAEIAALHF